METLRDDNEDEHLDLTFRKMLQALKPYVQNVMNQDHLNAYRLWLERLSRASSSEEKVGRNRYLMELARQIRGGVLEPPFTLIPPTGRLETILKKDFYDVSINPQSLTFGNLVIVGTFSYNQTGSTTRQSTGLREFPRHQLSGPQNQNSEKTYS